MKAIFFAIAFFLLYTGGAWAQDGGAPTVEENSTAHQSQETVSQSGGSELYEMISPDAAPKMILNDKFPDYQAQLSYAVGMSIGLRLSQALEYEILDDYFLLAVRQVYNDEPQFLTKQQAHDTLHAWQAKRRDAKIAEKSRIKPKEELEFHIRKASNGFPQQIANSTLILEGNLMDDLVKMDAESYGFTVEKFFETIEWGMQGAIVNATWKELAENKWEVVVGTMYMGSEPHTDILRMDYKPESNETAFSSYIVDGKSLDDPALRDAYENVLRLYQKH